MSVVVLSQPLANRRSPTRPLRATDGLVACERGGECATAVLVLKNGGGSEQLSREEAIVVAADDEDDDDDDSFFV